jgi:hypothetical protein
MPQPELRVVRRAIEELSEAQIEQLMNFGKREADLIDEMVAAARAGDRNLVWQIAQAMVEIEDQAGGSVV